MSSSFLPIHKVDGDVMDDSNVVWDKPTDSKTPDPLPTPSPIIPSPADPILPPPPAPTPPSPSKPEDPKKTIDITFSTK